MGLPNSLEPRLSSYSRQSGASITRQSISNDLPSNFQLSSNNFHILSRLEFKSSSRNHSLLLLLYILVKLLLIYHASDKDSSQYYPFSDVKLCQKTKTRAPILSHRRTSGIKKVTIGLQPCFFFKLPETVPSIELNIPN